MSRALPKLGLCERALIFNCARLEMDAAVHERTLDLLAGRLDWGAVFFHADLHGVAPLVQRQLKEFPEALIPESVRHDFLRASHRAGFVNRLFLHSLHEIVDCLETIGKPIIVLKGLSLVELIYGGLSRRPMIDHNLLVKTADVPEVVAAFRSIGYRDRVAWGLRSTSQWLYSQRPLVKAEGFTSPVFLQWNMINAPWLHAVDQERIWVEAEKVQISGNGVWILAPKDFLLFLCVQPYKRGFLNGAAEQVPDPLEFIFQDWSDNRLIQFVDLYETIRLVGGRVDWQDFTRTAQTSGIDGTAHIALKWLTKLYGPVVDEDVVKALSPPRVRYVRRKLFDALNQASDGQTGAALFQRLLRRWWLGRDKRTQIRCVQFLAILEFVFPPRRLPLNGRKAGAWSWSAYLAHVGRAVFACVSGGVPLAFHLIKTRFFSASSDASKTLGGMHFP